MSDSGLIDQRERFEDPEEASRHAMEAHRSDMWTAIPAIIHKHDTDKNTVHAQPSIKLKHVGADGTATWKEFPVLEDIPAHYPGAGGATITMPIQEGDECLLVCSARSIDKWWQSGGVQEQAHSRMHDISDSFAIMGFRSQPRKLSGVSSDSWQLRTEDGQTHMDFNPTTKQFTFVSPTMPVIIQGDLHVSGAIVAGFGGGDQVGLQTHTHNQPADSHGDAEQPTNKPNAGT